MERGKLGFYHIGQVGLGLALAGCAPGAPHSFEEGWSRDRAAPPPAASTTYKVCPDGTGAYTTIQSAVDAVATGSTLRLCEATYEENVTISGKTLSIRAISDRAETIVDGGGAGPVFNVSGSANVTLYNLTIQNGLGHVGGGGVRCSSSTLVVDNSLVTGNSAIRGGGVFASLCSAKVKNSLVYGNTASVLGGGVYYEGSSGKIRANEIYENTATEGGGVYVNNGTATIEANDIHDNTATTTDENIFGAGSGGGGVLVSGSIAVTDNTIEANHSNYNGGGLFVYQGSGEISGNTIQNNTADEDGGGIYTNYNSSWITNNTLSGNSAGDDGGGIRMYVGSATFEGNVVTDNTTVDNGGGIKLSHSYNEILDNEVTGNAAGSGGGIELDNDTSLIQGCVISNNTAAVGAGIRARIPDGALTLDDLTIHGNIATELGGGIVIVDAPYGGSLTHLDFAQNKAPYGGGLYAASSSFTLSNSIFDDNNGTTTGGGLYLEEISGTIANVVVFDNISKSGAGAGMTLVDLAGLTVYNTIVSGNDRGVGVLVSGTGPVSWTYNDVYDNVTHFSGMDDPTGTDGNLAVNPRFTSASTGDFTLKTTSALIDAGAPTVLDADGTRSDMGGFGGPYGSW